MRIRCLLVAAVLITGLRSSSRATLITLESAEMGPGSQPAAPSLSANNFVGWRFRVTSTFAVTEVGGHVGGNNGSLFAAIVTLSALDALPQGSPFATGSVVASTMFTPPTASADVRVPLAHSLAPGAYALVFGSGQFGATGSGLISNVEQPNIAPTTRTSYISWRQTLPSVFNWTVGSLNNLRFVVRGNEIAGAADFNLDGRIDALDVPVWKGGFGGSAPAGIASGDADLDGDVDGTDFLAWQRTLTPAGSTILSAPEPTSLTLALSLAGAAALRRRRRGCF